MSRTSHQAAASFAFVAIAWATAGLTGCSSLALSDPTGWMKRQEKSQTPTRMVAVWTDTVMNQPGQRGVRGVGGRVLFYASQDESPVAVRGTLSVYAYDDTEHAELDAVPARKFVFLPDQLNNHHSTSQLGHSYNVWLPWDEVGNSPRQLTLVARFEPEDGAVVMSDPARQLLPGIPSSTRVKKSTLETAVHHDEHESSSAKLASYEQSSGVDQGDAKTSAEATTTPKTSTPDRLETFTIDLPADVAHRWHTQVAHAAEEPRKRLEPAPASVGPTARTEAAPTPPTRRRRIESVLSDRPKKLRRTDR